MGRYYALHEGEDNRGANAIADHYKPLGPNDTCPTTSESIVVALADKIDTLVAFFRVGERPTGSGDPYALRRATQGIIRIVLEDELRLPLAVLFAYADVLVSQGRPDGVDEGESILDQLLPFFGDRFKVHLRDQGVRHDLITSAFSKIREDNGDLVRLLRRVDALRAFLDTEDGSSLLTAYRRAANIVAIEERRDLQPYDEYPDPDLFQRPEEKALDGALGRIGGLAGDLLNHENFAAAMSELARLRQPVDEFFDKVTVNVDEKNLRENRLRLLSRIRVTLNQVADFSRIEG